MEGAINMVEDVITKRENLQQRSQMFLWSWPEAGNKIVALIILLSLPSAGKKKKEK